MVDIGTLKKYLLGHLDNKAFYFKHFMKNDQSLQELLDETKKDQDKVRHKKDKAYRKEIMELWEKGDEKPYKKDTSE